MTEVNVSVFVRNEDYLNELIDYFNQTEGFNVCATALTGDLALEMIKKVNPHVAIIDPALKGIDGIKLLDHIKAL